MATAVEDSWAPMRWGWLVRSRAIVSLLIIAPFAIACVLSRPPAMEGSWADVDCDFIGWLLFMVGGGLALVGDALYCRAQALDDRDRRSLFHLPQSTLCRHLLHGLAVAFFLESVTFAAGLLLMTAYYLSITVLTEEQMLRQKFGQPFVDYCSTSCPLLAAVSATRNAAANHRQHAARPGSEAMRTGRWLWLPVLCEVSPICGPRLGGPICFICRSYATWLGANSSTSRERRDHADDLRNNLRSGSAISSSASDSPSKPSLVSSRRLFPVPRLQSA